MLKKVLYTLIMIVMFAMAQFVIANSYTSQTVLLTKIKSDPTKPEKIEPDPEGRRIPPKPIICTISQNQGLEIEGDFEEIIAYQVLDSDGEIMVAAFIDEGDFIDYIFSVSDSCQIRLVTENYALIGYID